MIKRVFCQQMDHIHGWTRSSWKEGATTSCEMVGWEVVLVECSLLQDQIVPLSSKSAFTILWCAWFILLGKEPCQAYWDQQPVRCSACRWRKAWCSEVRDQKFNHITFQRCSVCRWRKTWHFVCLHVEAKQRVGLKIQPLQLTVGCLKKKQQTTGCVWFCFVLFSFDRRFWKNIKTYRTSIYNSS